VELPAYYVVLPAFESVYQDITYQYAEMLPGKVQKPYNSASEKAMSLERIAAYLRKNQILEDE
jgi:hypothetical protein